MSVFTSVSTGRGVVSCDWFSMSCKLGEYFDGDTLPVPSDWSCLAMAPTAVWGKRWFILDEFGNKVATFLACPRTPKIPAVSANVQIANRWLYYEDFRSICDRVCDILPMAVCGLNRVDLCCDFEMTPQLYSTYLALAKQDAKLKGLGESVSWWKTLRTTNENGSVERVDVPNQVNWGGKDSTFKWKVYYKWLELKTAPPEDQKQWIVDTWKANGFSEQHVWRVEVSINNTNSLQTLQGGRVKPFDWFEDRVRLFQSLYSDKFVVRLKQGHADRRNDKILPFLEINEEKMLKHALPKTHRDDSDPEKRLVCKLWQELQSSDTQCNEELVGLIRGNLMQLLEKPSNVWIIERMYGVDIQRIIECVAPRHANSSGQ